jgi:uncharacterized protein YfdQ (DUF2303 family)
MPENVIQTFLQNGGAKAQTVSVRPDDKAEIPSVIIGAEQKLETLEHILSAPVRIKEKRLFDDLRGYVEYVNTYKGETTAIFASRERIQTVFDYHGKDKPAWGSHAIEFKYRRSTRWDLWEKANNKWFSQRDFADFLDSGLNEITRPAQGDILDIVKNFRATVNAEAESHIGQGGTHFEYRQTTKGGSAKKTDIEVPEYFAVQVAPFEGLAALNTLIEDAKKQIPVYEFRAKCNWRLDEYKPEFKIQLLNFEDAVDETLEAVRGALKELTGVTVYIGG